MHPWQIKVLISDTNLLNESGSDMLFVIRAEPQ